MVQTQLIPGCHDGGHSHDEIAGARIGIKKGAQRWRENTKKAQLKQKEYADKRRQAKVKEGDEVLLKREKSTTKSPWNPKPFKMVQVEGYRVTARRDEKKARATNHVKVVKIRSDYLRDEETFTARLARVHLHFAKQKQSFQVFSGGRIQQAGRCSENVVFTWRFDLSSGFNL